MAFFGLFPPSVRRLYLREDGAGLIDALAHRKSFAAREEAAWSLGRLCRFQQCGPAGVAALCDALADPDYRVADAAYRSLCELPCRPEAVAPMQAALTHASSKVRHRTAAALASIAKPPNLDVLLPALSSQDPGVQWPAACTLAEHRDERAADVLATLYARGEGGPGGYVVIALARLRSPCVAEALAAHSGDGIWRQIGQARLGDASVLPDLEAEIADPPIWNHPDHTWRRLWFQTAVEAVGELVAKRGDDLPAETLARLATLADVNRDTMYESGDDRYPAAHDCITANYAPIRKPAREALVRRGLEPPAFVEPLHPPPTPTWWPPL